MTLPAGVAGPVDYAEAWTMCWGRGCIEMDPSAIDDLGLCPFHRREILGSPSVVAAGATVGPCPKMTPT